MKYRAWLKSDIARLKAMAKKHPAKWIARKLKRSEGALRQKALACDAVQRTAPHAGLP